MKPFLIRSTFPRNGTLQDVFRVQTCTPERPNKSSYFGLRAAFPSHSFIPLHGQRFIYPKLSYGRRNLQLQSNSPKQLHLDSQQERRGGFTRQCLFSLLHLFLHAIDHFYCLSVSGASSFLSIHKDISRCDV